MSLDEKEDLKIRLLLRSVYLKGHQDGNLKTTDLSWEDKIVKDIDKLYEKNYLKGVEDGKEMVRKELPTVKELETIINNIWDKDNPMMFNKPNKLTINKIVTAISARIKRSEE